MLASQALCYLGHLPSQGIISWLNIFFLFHFFFLFEIFFKKKTLPLPLMPERILIFWTYPCQKRNFLGIKLVEDVWMFSFCAHQLNNRSHSRGQLTSRSQSWIKQEKNIEGNPQARQSSNLSSDHCGNNEKCRWCPPSLGQEVVSQDEFAVF